MNLSTSDAASASAMLRQLRTQRQWPQAHALLARLQPAPGPLAVEAFHLGHDFKRMQRAAEAADCFAFALRGQPQFVEAHLELGSLLLMHRRFLAAIPHFEAGTRLRPALGGAWLGLGQCLLHTGQGRAALDAFARVGGDFAASPLMAAWRGTATMHAGDEDGALALYTEALARDPQCYDALFGQALILDKRNDLEAAARGYARAWALNPQDNWALGNLAYALRRMAAWDALAAPQAELVARLERGEVNGYATQWIGFGLSAAAMRRVAAAFGRTQSALHALPAQPPPFRQRDAGERLRLAYVSNDFRDHATARLMVQMLESHDRDRVEVFAYSLAPDDGSDMRRRIAGACEHFIDVSGWEVARVAARLREDGIDLLIDLHGRTNGALEGLAALRPAPVIVSYLGFPGTMGDHADYIVGDRCVTPPGSEAEFSEAIVRLPGSYQPNDRLRAVGEATTRAAHGLPDDALVACSFNQTWKFGPQLWSVWMQAMVRHPRLVLWLLDENRWATQNLRQAAAQAGVDPARIVFAPRLPQAAHMARLALADLALDTAPCNSHTTASDALWMGVPLLSLSGHSFDARVGESVLCAAGLSELVAHDLPQYESMLDALLAAPQRLGEYKRALIDGRAHARLWDAPATARAFERACEAMYARFRAGLPPASIDIDDAGDVRIAQPPAGT